MTSETYRSDVAGKIRDLGHNFVERDLSDAQLSEIAEHLDSLNFLIANAEPRTRAISRDQAFKFAMPAPLQGETERSQLLSDSFVSGDANPFGLGGVGWREDELALMEVTLGSAFEGAPGRAHGGIVAALVDETMGLVLAMNDVLAYTVQLDISYLAPTPLHEPIRARAWLKERNGRKLSISASVHANEINLATASALFIEISAEKFLASVAVRD